MKILDILSDHGLSELTMSNEQWRAVNAAIKVIVEDTIDVCANEGAESELLCGNAINRKLKDKTSCGFWCGGCDQSVFDKESILKVKSQIDYEN